MLNSTPTFQEFDPRVIPYQMSVIDSVENYDFKKGVLEILLSGSVGSAKSILMAHLVVRHCLEYPGARVCLARKAMPDLKRTIFQTILDHLDDIDPRLFRINETQAEVYFANKSEIISTSWSDKKYKKVRSLQLSMAVFEELTENNDEDKQAYMELKMRVNRLPHVPQQLIISATNPDDPAHWVYDYFIKEKQESRQVFYSVTTDNPFLPKSYVDQLLKDLDPKMAERMIFGKWISIQGEGIYYQYDPAKHEPKTQYTLDTNHPIHFSWDFNIGIGKPMSCVFYQIIDGKFHFFDEIVIEGSRTENILEEAANKGIFENDVIFICHGDATASRRDTRSKLSDYEIIDQFMQRFRNKSGNAIKYRREVPASNPQIRERHNVVNAYLLNNLGEIRVQIYPNCKVLKDGFKLTKLKPGADYIEDDTKYFQHITTAAGYGIHWHNLISKKGKSKVIEL